MFDHYAPLDLSTKDVYDRFVACLPEALPSTLFFEGLYAWNQSSVNVWRVTEGHLCVIANDTWTPEYLALPPLGPLEPESFARTVDAVYNDFVEAALPCVFSDVPGYMLPLFDGLGGYTAETGHSRDSDDYLYTAAAFMDGVEKPSARRALSNLRRQYAPATRCLAAADAELVRQMTRDFYCTTHNCDDCVFGCELKVTGRLMDAFDALGLAGVLVEDGHGGPLAFQICCRQKNTLFCIDKKVRRSTRGVNEAVNLATLQLCAEGCAFVNYSEDMGLEGLRSYKSRLGEHTLQHKYRITLTAR